MPGTVCVPINADLYNEFILRTGKSENVANWIEDIVSDFLERTKDDLPDWSDGYYENLADNEAMARLRDFGPPHKGYQWQNLFLPNGTQLRMTYKSDTKLAQVRHQQVFYDDQACSPSGFVRRAAGDTNRNAWRDIWIKRPSDKDWIFADTLRRQS